MSITKQIECNVCNDVSESVKLEDGWQGWGSISGKKLEDNPEIHMCPTCLDKVYIYIAQLITEAKDG